MIILRLKYKVWTSRILFPTYIHIRTRLWTPAGIDEFGITTPKTLFHMTPLRPYRGFLNYIVKIGAKLTKSTSVKIDFHFST